LIENFFTSAHKKRFFRKKNSPKIISSKTLRSGISEIDPCVRLKWFERLKNISMKCWDHYTLFSTFWSLTVDDCRADVYLPSYRLWSLIVELKDNEVSGKWFMKPERLSRVRFVSNFYIQKNKKKQKNTKLKRTQLGHTSYWSLSLL
jgi:hypothetical protein